jgi:ABC-type lipoprotein export system ATPase subunit
MAIKKMNLNFKKGEFVCIIGDVGSGKSSLLSALIGDMLHLPLATLDTFGPSLIWQDKQAMERVREDQGRSDFE